MSPQTLSTVLERLRSRAESNPAFADALKRLAESNEGDPFEDPGVTLRRAAAFINRDRQAERIAELETRSWTSREVVDVLASVSDRKGVDRRRSRGQLLGIRHGRQMLHPRWQFDRRRGDTVEGLTQVLSALREVAADDIDMDAIATSARMDLEGRSPAQLLADGQVDLAIRAIRMAADQS